MSRRYLLMLLVLLAASLLPVLLLNLLLGRYALDEAGKAHAAFEWQRGTHGIAYLPTSGSDALFKLLQLQDRLPDTNTVVFGSSTAQPITAGMFPAPMRAYNFAQHGHGLNNMLGEADYLLEHSDVKWLVIPLDWSIGFLYQDGGPAAITSLAPDGLESSLHQKDQPLLARMLDAMSRPRVMSLFAILSDILRATDKAGAFRQYFLQPASDQYTCADGTPAKDFDTIHRGLCAGLRYDGSATFSDSERVTNPQKLLAMALVDSSKYSMNLDKTRGEPNPAFLQKLAELARRAEKKGGGVILFMPPLLTGMEQAFLHNPQRAPELQHTKAVLRDWAQRENLVIFDAGQAERFDCPADEFVDQHHALSGCYAKVWGYFWGNIGKADGNRIMLPRGGMY